MTLQAWRQHPDLHERVAYGIYEFGHNLTKSSVRCEHFLPHAVAVEINYNITTYAHFLEHFYGRLLQEFLTEMYDQQIGERSGLPYLKALVEAWRCEFHRYSIRQDPFQRQDQTAVYDPRTMTHKDWLTILRLQYADYKGSLTVLKEMEFTQNRLLSKLVEPKPLGHKPKVALPAEPNAGRVEKAPAKALVAPALNLGGTVSEDQILNALQQAHIASDGYYNVTHAQQWNTTIEFPPEAVAADAALLQSCGNDFSLMCRAKQSKLAHNRLSVRRVLDTFGPLGTKIPGMLPADFALLLEFAPNRITPPVGTDFVPQADNLPPLRQRYITLKHTVNSLLFKKWGDGTMALLDTERAKQIQGIHFSAQHQADSKGKQEGRVIGDLSGQHDPAYTPLNGTSDSKDALRRGIAHAWGKSSIPQSSN